MSTIDMNKNYRYANGEPARILCVNRPAGDNNFPPVVSLAETGTFYFHTRDGNTPPNSFQESDRRLVEVGPYDDFEIDDPVMVRDELNRWHRRYFAGVDEGTGKARAWNNGATSWSSRASDWSEWEDCIKAKAEGCTDD